MSAVTSTLTLTPPSSISGRGLPLSAWLALLLSRLTSYVEHRLTIVGVVEELYDVAVLPGVIRPSALGFRTDEIRFLVRPAAG